MKKNKQAMQTVFKFPIAPCVEMPEGATILHVAFDPSTPGVCAWALVDPTAAPAKRFFAMAKTGDPLDPRIADCPHLATVVVTLADPTKPNGLKTAVTHVWEVPGYLVKPPTTKGDEWKEG